MARDSNMTMIWLLYRHAIFIDTPPSLRQPLTLLYKVENRSANSFYNASYIGFLLKINRCLLNSYYESIEGLIKYCSVVQTRLVVSFAILVLTIIDICLFGNCVTVCLSVRKLRTSGVNATTQWVLNKCLIIILMVQLTHIAFGDCRLEVSFWFDRSEEGNSFLASNHTSTVYETIKNDRLQLNTLLVLSNITIALEFTLCFFVIFVYFYKS